MLARPVCWLVLASMLILATGCGSSGPRVAHGPSNATMHCRAQWRMLGEQIVGRDQQPDPSDLAARWTSVLATVQYYVTSATATDCPTGLGAQRSAIAGIDALSTRLRPYDIAYRMSALAPVATDYLLNPVPKPRKVGKRVLTPPTHKQVQAALTVLQNEATVSASDMGDGWDEAATVDPTDPAAVDKVVADLVFLSQDSTAFQQCSAALAMLTHASQFTQ